jgi:hypothetical protein
LFVLGFIFTVYKIIKNNIKVIKIDMKEEIKIEIMNEKKIEDLNEKEIEDLNEFLSLTEEEKNLKFQRAYLEASCKLNTDK